MQTNKTAEQLLEEAAGLDRKVQESWERSDTDGFLTQWALDLGAQKLRAQAEIVANGGMGTFIGLYEGDRRVIAKRIQQPRYGAPWLTDTKWFLSDDEFEKFGRRYIPVGDRSRIQKQLGLCERQELDLAEAVIEGSGRGLSGNAWVAVVRRGDIWGRDAKLIAS